MPKNTSIKKHTGLKLLAALALLSSMAPVREAHAQYISGAGFGEAIVVGGVALSGILAAGGIVTGAGTTWSNSRAQYLPGWAASSFVSSAFGIGLAAILIPSGFSLLRSSDQSLATITLGAGLIHGAIGAWNLVAALQNRRYKDVPKTGPTLTPVALGDWSRKNDKRWFGVGVQLSNW